MIGQCVRTCRPLSRRNSVKTNHKLNVCFWSVCALQASALRSAAAQSALQLDSALGSMRQRLGALQGVVRSKDLEIVRLAKGLDASKAAEFQVGTRMRLSCTGAEESLLRLPS